LKESIESKKKGKDIEKYKILEIIFLLNRNDKKIQELGKKGFWRN